ncbi:DUF3006 family protein [Fontibacillus phaseoli]|uniref:DUF3006 family protein n=1 Tax=Fontibacillus phaseoli TaxID=1416533 RepID=A0A369BNK9_9BACL|nr:DUF3006 domain-containing protein [Fontibacillus phaseoli]RCX22981.1 DUF3006 family protein [Fontibacillus phaseoli]
MSAIVEGFEGDICILEIEGQRQDVSRQQVDDRVKAGDVVLWNGEQWIPDLELTEERTRKIKKLMDEVWED